MIYSNTSQNKGVTVKPLPEPPPTDWLIRRPIVLLSAETHDDHGLNLPKLQYRKIVVPLLEYPSWNRIPIRDQGHSKNRHKKYQTSIHKTKQYKNLETVSKQILALGKKITIKKPEKDPGF